MYDVVRVACPRCGRRLEFQSKAGPCELREYDEDDCPPAVAGSIIGSEESCGGCGAVVEVKGQVVLKPRAKDWR